ncbi:MAG: TetR/AcrR family transcriptional regulator [Bacillota bacterium]
MVSDILHRREAILLTAIDLLDEKGIQGLSTKEIARRQEISESAVFKFFKTKNELVSAILDRGAIYDEDIAESARLKGFEPIEALYYCIKAYAEYYENYPAVISIMNSLMVLMYEPELSHQIIKIMGSRYEFILSVIKDAQKKGYIKDTADEEVLADIVLGILSITCIKWKMSGFAFPLKERIVAALDMVIGEFKV